MFTGDHVYFFMDFRIYWTWAVMLALVVVVVGAYLTVWALAQAKRCLVERCATGGAHGTARDHARDPAHSRQASEWSEDESEPGIVPKSASPSRSAASLHTALNYH